MKHDAKCPARCATHECHKPPGKCTCGATNFRVELKAARELADALLVERSLYPNRETTGHTYDAWVAASDVVDAALVKYEEVRGKA